MSLLRRIEKSMDARLRGLFAGGSEQAGAREAIELYRDALEQVSARVTAGKRGERLFPFNLITVELAAKDAERKAVLETLFEAGQLLDDVRSTLREERVEAPADLTVVVHFPETPEQELQVICEKAGKLVPVEKPAAQPKPARLVTLKGSASHAEFVIGQPLVNLGRESEVIDRGGRPVRQNDLFFPEEAHEANSSVSRSHAHIRFDPVGGEWRIFDDGSSVGTSLFRAGKRIEVPPHGGRGVALKAGDEIYLGQVRLRFETADSPPSI
jgi:hypothetical protein